MLMCMFDNILCAYGAPIWVQDMAIWVQDTTPPLGAQIVCNY